MAIVAADFTVELPGAIVVKIHDENENLLVDQNGDFVYEKETKGPYTVDDFTNQ